MGNLTELGIKRPVIGFIFLALLCCFGCNGKNSKMFSAEKTEIKVNPETFDVYTGKYYHRPYSIKISKEGDTLCVEKKGDKKYELYPTSEDTFCYRGARAHITFNREKDGSVRSLSLFQFGKELVAAKVK